MSLKKIINVYGCSWTHGVPNVNDRKSWPYYLSLILPKNYEIHSYAIGGSSLCYSVFQLHKCKKDADINIFQCTSPCRFTAFDGKNFTNKNLIETYPRLKEFYFTYAKSNCLAFNVGGIEQFNKKDRTWFGRWLQMADKATEESNRLSGLYYVKHHSDFVFSHLDYYDFDLGIVSIEKEFGSETFLSMCGDKGFHFGEEGSRKVANFVYKNIKEKIE